MELGPQPKASEHNLPSVMQLARLAGMLASHSLPESLNSATITHWKVPAYEARELWLSCGALLARTPDVRRSELEVDELASLAAILAHGRNVKADSPDRLAEAAFRLWQRCRTSTDRFGQMLEVATEAARTSERIPSPGKYPVPFKKALRLMLPGKSIPERMHLLRGFLREAFRVSLESEGQPGVDDEGSLLDLIEAKIVDFKKNGLNKEYYQHYARHLPSWATEYAAKQRIIRARKGGEAKARRHSKM